jgi:hypothetical protein
VNLWQRAVDRVHVSPTETEYHLVPNRKQPVNFDIHKLDTVTYFELDGTVLLQARIGPQLILHKETDRRAFQTASVLVDYGKKKGSGRVGHSSAAEGYGVVFIGTVNAGSVTAFAGCGAVERTIAGFPRVRISNLRGRRLCLVLDLDLYALRRRVRNLQFLYSADVGLGQHLMSGGEVNRKCQTDKPEALNA